MVCDCAKLEFVKFLFLISDFVEGNKSLNYCGEMMCAFFSLYFFGSVTCVCCFFFHIIYLLYILCSAELVLPDV